MMVNDKHEEIGLDAYFEAARATTVEPSNDLLGRIEADANALIMSEESSLQIKSPGFVAAIWSAIGGWPTAVGMATATLVGVWIGLSQPAGLDLVSEVYLGVGEDVYMVDLMPAFGDDLEEG